MIIIIIVWSEAGAEAEIVYAHTKKLSTWNFQFEFHALNIQLFGFRMFAIRYW